MKETLTDSRVLCYHCGDECRETTLTFDSKTFCCDGCKLRTRFFRRTIFAPITNSMINQAFLPNRRATSVLPTSTMPRCGRNSFSSATILGTSVTFYIPQMHCSSCIWLLEHLYRINQAVVRSRVNF